MEEERRTREIVEGGSSSFICARDCGKTEKRGRTSKSSLVLAWVCVRVGAGRLVREVWVIVKVESVCGYIKNSRDNNRDSWDLRQGNQ